VIPRRPLVYIPRRVPILAAGVAIGEIPAELLEAVINLASGGPTHADGVPLSTEEVLERVRQALA
jgi:hypothetical protein